MPGIIRPTTTTEKRIENRMYDAMLDGMLEQYFKWIFIYGLIFFGWVANIACLIGFCIAWGRPNKSNIPLLIVFMLMPFSLIAVFIYYQIEKRSNGNRSL
jgi:hypothetical protein